MILFGLAFGLVELLFFSVFAIALIIATATDRHGNNGHKWTVILVAIALVGAWYWPDWTLFGPAHVDTVITDGGRSIPAHDRVVLFNAITSSDLWKPLGWFLIVGVGYAVFEFFFGVWRAAREYRERWASYLKKNVDIKSLSKGTETDLSKALSIVGTPDDFSYGSVLRAQQQGEHILAISDKAHAVLTSEANSILRGFCSTNTKAPFIVASIDNSEIRPEIQKWSLTRWLTAWTCLWPAYALSLIFGDLLREVFIAFTDMLVAMSTRFVRATFADVFKI